MYPSTYGLDVNRRQWLVGGIAARALVGFNPGPGDDRDSGRPYSMQINSRAHVKETCKLAVFKFTKERTVNPDCIMRPMECSRICL
jgi:hypothetical protein